MIMWTMCQDARLVFRGMFRDRLIYLKLTARQVDWYQRSDT